MNVWRLITHWNEPQEVLDWSRINSRIAIGWGRAGDIRDYTSAREIVGAVRNEYPTNQNVPFSGGQLWNFCHTLTQDDLVILSLGKSGGRALVVQVKGDYEFVSSEEAPLQGDFQHQRKVEITPLDPNHLWQLAGSQPAIGHNIRWTLIKCLRPVDASDL
jgi:predicted Mrr-cat superfamily restriction endonuclease